MKTTFITLLSTALLVLASGCTRIEIGEVGLRVKFDKTTDPTERIAALNAMANLKIAEGVAAGKVHTVVVPYDFQGIVNAK